MSSVTIGSAVNAIAYCSNYKTWATIGPTTAFSTTVQGKITKLHISGTCYCQIAADHSYQATSVCSGNAYYDVYVNGTKVKRCTCSGSGYTESESYVDIARVTVDQDITLNNGAGYKNPTVSVIYYGTVYRGNYGNSRVGVSFSAITGTKKMGGQVNVGGTWKEADCYVNVDGTWKEATPYGNVSGTWKELE